jgi:hypothetical protein
MNSASTSAMDMPPCDDLAVAIAEMRDLFQKAANRRHPDDGGQQLTQLP